MSYFMPILYLPAVVFDATEVKFCDMYTYLCRPNQARGQQTVDCVHGLIGDRTHSHRTAPAEQLTQLSERANPTR